MEVQEEGERGSDKKEASSTIIQYPMSADKRDKASQILPAEVKYDALENELDFTDFFLCAHVLQLFYKRWLCR
jgi:hypothetical protein